MSRTIDNRQDILDSRDIIARIEELKDIEEPDDDEQEEMKALLALQEEASSSPDWMHGEGLIRDSYFVRYAQELADDIGAVNKDNQWPNQYINWDAAAEALQQDYMSVDFDGVTYWIRA